MNKFALLALINFANDKDDSAMLPPLFQVAPYAQSNTLYEASGPYLKICSLPRSPSGWAALRRATRDCLEAIADRSGTGSEATDASFNSHGIRSIVLAPAAVPTEGHQRGSTGPAVIIPAVDRFELIPIALVTLAHCTPTGNGDTLADRIARCDHCRNFFLQKTRQVVRFCGDTCRRRGKNANRKR